MMNGEEKLNREKDHSLKDLFSEILADPCNGEIESAVAAGEIPVGYTCSYVPEAMLSAGRLFPVRLRAPGISGTESADTYMPSTLCSYTRSLLEYFLEGRYDFLGGMVFTAGCDHLRRLHDNMGYLGKHGFLHIIDVPHKLTPRAVSWMRDELDILRRGLAGHFGLNLDDASLAKAIDDYNGTIEALRSIGEMRKQPNPPFSGADFHCLMLASMTLPKKSLSPLIDRWRERLRGRPGIGNYRARLMVAGGHMDDPRYIETIESMGGLVVADRFCTGSIPHLTPIPAGEDPLEAMARHVFDRTDCPRMMGGFRDRADRIIRAARDYAVDGVVIETIKFCDIWGYETAALVTALREAGVPVLRLEREYRLAGEGQIRTRVQAFLESMGK